MKCGRIILGYPVYNDSHWNKLIKGIVLFTCIANGNTSLYSLPICLASCCIMYHCRIKIPIYFTLYTFWLQAALGHTAWGIALSWITVACCCGYGGPLNCLFSFRGFLPLSRLTYCAYLIHPVIMCFSSFILDGPIHLQQSLVVSYFANWIL